MKMNLLKKIRSQGFTLVELIITIVIITILTSAAVLRCNDLSKAAELAACHTNQLSLKKAQTLFYAKSVVDQIGEKAEELAQLAPFLNGEMPVCPAGGSYYITAQYKITCTLDEHQFREGGF